VKGGIGHPVTKVLSTPDFNYHPWLVGFRNSMELMLTGDSVSGDEAAAMGYANRAYPPDELDERVLDIAVRIAAVPSDLQQINKRSVHRAMETMGVRAAIRNATEFQALAGHQASAIAARADALARIKGATSI
jgi:enoyl-CoA hydratase